MQLDEAKQILKNAGYLIEDFEEDVARKRLNELEGTFDIQGDEANFF
jgi:parvulin-like peptidyl-prolyl isomerase